MKHGRGVRCIACQFVALLKLKVSEVNLARAIGNERTEGYAHDSFFLFEFYYLCKADKVVDDHKLHLPIERPLNFTDVADPACGDDTCLQH